MSDEERRKLLKPNVSHADVLALLRSYFSATDTSKVVVLKSLDSYDDQNFLVSINDVQLLLKVHNGVESDNSPVIDLQNSIMLHLNKDSSVRTTAPLPPTSPSALPSPPLSVRVSLPVASSLHSPYPLCVRLLTFLPGSPMSSSPVPPSLLVRCGSYLASVDALLDALAPHPAADRFHQWDGKNTAGLRPFAAHVPDGPKRRLVAQVLDAFEAKVLPCAGDFRTGVLQADFNDANIIVGEDGQLAGVIDFGDAVKR